MKQEPYATDVFINLLKLSLGYVSEFQTEYALVVEFLQRTGGNSQKVRFILFRCSTISFCKVRWNSVR